MVFNCDCESFQRNSCSSYTSYSFLNNLLDPKHKKLYQDR